MLTPSLKKQFKKLKISPSFNLRANKVVYYGDCLKLLKQIPDETAQLIITSPPYNIGKEYERKLKLNHYVEQQETVIKECVRVLSQKGSLCWQVGNYVNKGEIIPLDVALAPVFQSCRLKMRNRIIWHFAHGLHCAKRFSGRYETILWFTKSDNYTFNLDPVRVPQKYPNKKYFKGPKTGQYSCNPLGKNPGDLWQIPNVKNNHVEKTDYPCQFPVELAEPFVLSMTNKGDWVLDPFLGSGTSLIAGIKHGRKAMGAEVNKKYIKITCDRMDQFEKGLLKTRPMNTPIYDPKTIKPNRPVSPEQESLFNSVDLSFR
ncbi:MAG: site-specific DNA-methyltransferase [Oligoflexia bacterium]|nr:site-specific DNA-methyltransferase [Oligoflexia bacterium]